MPEVMSGMTICPNCHSHVKYSYTPSGLLYCHKCNYSPTIGRVLFGTTSTDSPQHSVPSAPKVQ